MTNTEIHQPLDARELLESFEEWKRERHHRVSIDFKGSPLDHAIEEALDLLVYLWVMKRRRDAGGVDAEWRPMTPESQQGCQEWIASKLATGFDGGEHEDMVIVRALGLLRTLWEEKQTEALAEAVAIEKREAMEVAV